MRRNTKFSLTEFPLPLGLILTLLFVKINCLSKDDYQYPHDYQDDTEGADAPEEFANEPDPEPNKPAAEESGTHYPPKETQMGRAFKKDATYKWKTMNIYIERSEFTESEIKIINKAAFTLHKLLKPCGVHIGIWKEGKAPYGDYVKIVNREGCWSGIGRFGGEQILSLSTKGDGTCVCKQVVLHELLHALGFSHEQCRPDRDKYLTILLDNVKPSQKHNYEIDEDTDTLGIPYNPHSIMHYSDDSFVKEPGLKSMISKQGHELGWRGDPNNPLQDSDIEMIKKAYCHG